MNAKVFDKTDIAALRKADSICIDYKMESLSYTDSAAAIRAIKKAKRSDPFGQDSTYVIDVDSRVNGFNLNGGKIRSAFVHFGSNQFTPELTTIWNLLRAGDTIRVRFTASNNSQILDEVNLHNDEARLIVTRKNGLELVFLIEAKTSKNNSARMCKVY